MTSEPNLPFHAARILLLIGLRGRQKSRADKLPELVGRTLLAKLDFFVRYPAYLRKAAVELNRTATEAELGITEPDEDDTVEARMVRYLYGPWDHLYYPTLAYLVGKGLIEVDEDRGTDVFRVTAKGLGLVDTLRADPSFAPLAARIRYVN